MLPMCLPFKAGKEMQVNSISTRKKRSSTENTDQIRKSDSYLTNATDSATDMATSLRTFEPLIDMCYDNVDAFDDACCSSNMMTIGQDDGPSMVQRYLVFEAFEMEPASSFGYIALASVFVRCTFVLLGPCHVSYS
jgi:hypothetical protein